MKRQQREDDVFAIPAFWRHSRWDRENPENPSPFFSQWLLSITGLDQNLEHKAPNFAATQASPQDGVCLLERPHLNPDELGFFRLPDLLEQPEIDPQSTKSTYVSRTNGNQTISDDEIDGRPEFWMQAGTSRARIPLYKTWDGFISGEHLTSQPLYLTEAGAAVYDALLTCETDPLALGNADVPMVKTKAYLTSLISVAAGWESVFFAKQPNSGIFKPTLPHVRISGYSSNCIESLERHCMACGEIILGLRDFVQATDLSNTSRCTVALSSAVGRILGVLQQQLDVGSHNPRSVLQLRATINKVSSVLVPLRKLVGEAAQGKTDEAVLSIVFRHACVMECKEAFVREMLHEILRVVSLPWLELLEEWIGTKTEEGLPLTKNCVGQTKGFVKVESETFIDDFGEEFEDVEYRLDAQRLPEFFPEDIAQLAFDTGKNLRLIRESYPTHPLVTAQRTHSTRLLNAPKAQWAFGWDDVLRLERKVIQYESDLKAAISETAAQSLACPSNLLTSDEPPHESSSVFGASQSQIEQMILSSMKQLSTPVDAQQRSDPFVVILEHNLRCDDSSKTKHDSIAVPHPSLLPVLSFGGIVSSQANVVNRESLKLLFNTHSLRDHLKVQRDFHLLGNGLFCSRLSHALFDPDLETAERQAGLARQGGVMGLRLGSRDTWPPASSELRLALMGILTDTFMGGDRVKSISKGPLESTGLPGDLSFAVRDLSPEDIEKCMNPDSLEALDFLRLSYTTPKELRVVITPVALMQYDRIFKFLVRLLRLMYVADQLFRIVNLKTSAWNEPSNTDYRFAREARHFVSSIAAYFLDTGITLPWQDFQSKMDQMQAELVGDDIRNPEQTCSPETLRDYHSKTLNQITSALFLRKRQQPVIQLLEDIFRLVLDYAKHARLKAIGSVVEGEHTKVYSERLYRDFKKKLQIFISVCRTLTEKARSGAQINDTAAQQMNGLGDNSMVSQLLLKLDISHYYTKS